METDGTWAGHMELQAASPVTRKHVPRWYIRNFGDRGIRMIHLSYHDGEHYNSVRLKDDPFDGPARPIVIKADADLSVPSHQTKVVDNKPHGRAGREAFQPGSIRMVMAGTGCENAEKVEQILEQVNGDVDAAIEFLIAEQRTEECSANSDSLPSQANTHKTFNCFAKMINEFCFFQQKLVLCFPRGDKLLKKQYHEQEKDVQKEK
ncbi:hypothetical protein JHK87_012263 [Glycine soja]|nr:hypothetical protein JHK87_012263 [Glycine soja]